MNIWIWHPLQLLMLVSPLSLVKIYVKSASFFPQQAAPKTTINDQTEVALSHLTITTEMHS